MNLKRWAIINHQFEGLHNYPDAQGEQKYLSHLHRHLFKITIWLEQFHDDRDIEYLDFLNWLKSICPSGDLKNTSCEQLAINFIDQVQKKYPDRQVKVRVMEDGENGSFIETQ